MKSLCLVLCLLAGGGLIRAQSPTASSTAVEVVLGPDWTMPVEEAKSIVSLAVSPDGKFLAAVGDDDTVRVYQEETNRSPNLKYTLTGQGQLSPWVGFGGPHRIVTLWFDNSVKICDAASGELLHSTGMPIGKTLRPAIAPNQPLLAAAETNQVTLWNCLSGELLQTFSVNDSAASALDFTPDGKFLIVGTFKGVIRVINVADRKQTQSVDLDTPVRALAVANNRIAVGYEDGNLNLLNLNDGKSIPEVKGHRTGVRALAFSPSGDWLASASLDGIARVWDGKTLKPRFRLAGSTVELKAMVFNPNGRQVIAGTADGKLSCWTLPQ
jgi:WD40 repeat protein